MSPITIGILGVAMFLILMFCGMGIAFAMMFGSSIAIIMMRGPMVAGQLIAAEMVSTFSSYSLTVGPMFGLMGFLASYTGIGADLFQCLKSFVGHRKGGLASSVQVACAGFGAICGSIPATAATMSAVAYPEMRKEGYAVELAALCIVGGATLSTLIPPSNILIIYGTAQELSISRLFCAGVLPGVTLMILNIFLIKYLCWRNPGWAQPSRKFSWKERWTALTNGGVIQIAIVFALAMGGMFAGFFTPTEAGAVGVFGMLLVTLFSKNLTFKRLCRALLEGVRLQAMLYVLMACGSVLGKSLTLATIPTTLGRWVQEAGLSPLLVLSMIIFIYFVMGCFTDLMSMMLATLPVFYPIVVNYCGYDPAWFGVLIILLMSVGNMTPPVGSSVFMQKNFIASVDPDVPVSVLFRASWPWVWERFVMMIVLVAFPSLVTWLPNMLNM